MIITLLYFLDGITFDLGRVDVVDRVESFKSLGYIYPRYDGFHYGIIGESYSDDIGFMAHSISFVFLSEYHILE